MPMYLKKNKLKVSDGTVKGGPDIYRFGKEGDVYVFKNSATTDVLPNGEIYLKYHSAYKRDVFYLSDADVPEKITELVLHEKEDNNPQIEQYKGRTIKKVVLDGHTLYKNHMWNTICLPFDIISGPIPLPTHKRIYTVNRSTFVNKKAREQFQLSDYKRLIDIYSSTAKTVDALMKLELPSGVEVEIKV